MDKLTKTQTATKLVELADIPTQHNTTQHNTTQHKTTQHNTTQHNTTTMTVGTYPTVIQRYWYSGSQ